MREVDDLIKKAKRFLRTAELALNDGDYDSCVSRCYYAMFFMAEALLLTRNLKASSHKGVIALFGEHMIYDKWVIMPSALWWMTQKQRTN